MRDVKHKFQMADVIRILTKAMHNDLGNYTNWRAVGRIALQMQMRFLEDEFMAFREESSILDKVLAALLEVNSLCREIDLWFHKIRALGLDPDRFGLHEGFNNFVELLFGVVYFIRKLTM